MCRDTSSQDVLFLAWDRTAFAAPSIEAEWIEPLANG
jgi:hypothetical protein